MCLNPDRLTLLPICGRTPKSIILVIFMSYSAEIGSCVGMLAAGSCPAKL